MICPPSASLEAKIPRFDEGAHVSWRAPTQLMRANEVLTAQSRAP